MNGNHEHPQHRAGCQAPGRRRAASTTATARRARRPARDICPDGRRLPDPDHEAFVQWFVGYWRSNGTQLLVGQPNAKETHEPND